MQHIHVAFLDPDHAYAKLLAKKSGESDYLSYNYKEHGKVLCLYEPHVFPDKVQSLLHCIHLADYIVWVVRKVDADFAEIALALWTLGKPGQIILEGVEEEQLAPILSKSPMWSWPRIVGPINPNDLRVQLLARPELPVNASEPKRAVIDACFAVGGVGTVALTKVLAGTFAVHDELEITPSKIMSGVRSIQVQDEDVKSVEAGGRAGFALKNVDPGQAARGSYLAPAGTVKVFSHCTAAITLSPLVKDELAPGTELFISYGLQYVSARLQTDKPITAAMGETEVPLAMAAPAAGLVGERFLLCRSNKRPRVIGSGVFKALN